MPCKKSMDPYGPWFDYSVMWIMTGSHSSNGCFVLSLKTVSFHLFSVFFFPYTTLFGAYALNKIETLKQWNPHLTLWALCLSLTLSITSLISASPPCHRHSSAQIVAHSLNHSLPLSHSHYISASLPSLLLHRILAQIARYFILFNSSFFSVNLYFLANFSQAIKQHIIC